MTDMIKLANGSEVSADVFYTWGTMKQRYALMGYSDERRKKLSQSLTGHTTSEETRKKISDSKKGSSVFLEQARQKMSDARTGKKFNRPVMTPNGIFESRSAVALAAGVHYKTVGWWFKKWPEHYYYVKK
jgi:hypothetical protein